LDVNGDVSFSSDFVYWDTAQDSLTAGDIALSGVAIDAKLLPGHTSILNPNPGVASAQGTILYSQTSGEALTVGQLVYYQAASGRWFKTDADALTTTEFILGITLKTVGAAANTISVLIDGVYTTLSIDGVATIGDPLYVGTTAGNVSATVPTAAGSIIRGIGNVIRQNGSYYTINFRPDTTYFTNG
jgi:hypothetical protein